MYRVRGVPPPSALAATSERGEERWMACGISQCSSTGIMPCVLVWHGGRGEAPECKNHLRCVCVRARWGRYPFVCVWISRRGVRATPAVDDATMDAAACRFWGWTTRRVAT